MFDHVKYSFLSPLFSFLFLLPKFLFFFCKNAEPVFPLQSSYLSPDLKDKQFGFSGVCHW